MWQAKHRRELVDSSSQIYLNINITTLNLSKGIIRVVIDS